MVRMYTACIYILYEMREIVKNNMQLLWQKNELYYYNSNITFVHQSQLYEFHGFVRIKIKFTYVCITGC